MAKKAKPVVEEVDELEELEELEEEAPPKKSKKTAKAEEKPAKKPRRAASEDDEETSAYNAKWLCEYITEQTGKEYTPASLRVLLRKMARSGDLAREVGVDRGRYEFTGPNDSVVKAVLKAVKEGAIEKEKTERLQAVKDKKAAGKKAKADPEPEDDDEDDEDEEEEAPAPKKKATRRR